MYRLAGKDYDRATTCLLVCPTLPSLLKMLNNRFCEMPRRKIFVDLNDAWGDLVAVYKCSTLDLQSQLRIILDGQPAIDTGGVRRQVYTTVFQAFANNQPVKLFDGSVNNLRPACTAEARSSGLWSI